MLYWSADERTGTTHSMDRVRQSDVLILLVAHRYGYVPANEGYSVTELEYRAACAAAIPVLAFFLDDSVPWPPDYVEWEAKDRLRAFKQLVEAEVTRKVFRTTQELATQVTQALAILLARRIDLTSGNWRFSGPVRDVSTPARLRTDPNMLVQISTSQDGLLLLLDVSHSHDLSMLFQQLRDAVSAPNRPAPDAMLETFHQSLEQFATETWAAIGLVDVGMRTGLRRQLYVTRFTLSGPFTSVLAALLSERAATHKVDLMTAQSLVAPVPPPLDAPGIWRLSCSQPAGRTGFWDLA